MFMKSETVLVETIESLAERRAPQNQVIPTKERIQRYFHAGPPGSVNVNEDEPPRMTDYHVVLCPGVRNEAFRDRKVALLCRLVTLTSLKIDREVPISI